MIKSIQIKNIRGFGEDDNKFELNLIPNKPCFLVAPNGFGKSSIAKAFNCLGNRNRIDIKIEDVHKKNEDLIPEVTINISDEVFTANNDKNEILKQVQVTVINNSILPKVKKRKTASGFNVQSAEIKIPDINIIDKIPEKITTDFYKITIIKKTIKNKNNDWTNIKDLISNSKFLIDVYNYLEKFQKKTSNKKILEFLNSQEKINDTIYEKIKNEEFENIVSVVIDFFKIKKLEATLISIQLIWVYLNNIESFKNLFQYNLYIENKKFAESFFNIDSWFILKPKEIIVKDKKVTFKKYGIEFPNATDISNGERDVTVFLASLLNSYFNLNSQKKDIILIIDEVFDYLDDSNLIVVQYFLNKFIEKCTSLGIKIYPIILTHLDTYYFSNYAFKDFNVFYLNKWRAEKDINVESLIILRNSLNRKDSTEKDLYKNISKHFLHFHTENFDINKESLIEYLKKYKCLHNSKVENILKSENFKESCLESLKNYVENKKNYEPVSVCVGLRIIVEEIVYYKLFEYNPSLCNEFLDVNETIKKLNYANNYINVSGDFYLLSIIYNEVLHIKKDQDNNSRLFLKLDNIFIKNIIKKILLQYKILKGSKNI